MKIDGSVAFITDAERVGQVAGQCADVNLLVNNAGFMMASTFIDAPSLDAARLEMETNISARSACAGPSLRSLGQTVVAPWSTCCRLAASTPIRSMRHTGRRRRRRSP